VSSLLPGPASRRTPPIEALHPLVALRGRVTRDAALDEMWASRFDRHGIYERERHVVPADVGSYPISRMELHHPCGIGHLLDPAILPSRNRRALDRSYQRPAAGVAVPTTGHLGPPW
jgi:hypothetical protein